MLRQRLILGPVLIAALVGLIWLDEWIEVRFGLPAVIILPALVFIGVQGAVELTYLMHRREIPVSPKFMAASVVVGLVAVGVTPRDVEGVSGIAIVCTALAAMLLASFVYYTRDKMAEGVAAAGGATLLAFVYLGLMGGFLILLRREHSAWLLLAILLTTKSYDIGAFFTGRAVGRHKLIQWLSPGKTWEGLIGGLVTAGAVGALCVLGARAAGVAVLGDWGDAPADPVGWGAGRVELVWWQGLVGGVLFGLVGQAGDLVASLLKRDAGVKDSSSALPGFGGWLDVVDSPLVVAPVAYWTLKLVELAGI